MISHPATEAQLAPWQAESSRLWSLFDMLRFYGATFVTVVTEFEQTKADLGFGDLDEARATLIDRVTALAKELADLPISMSLRGQADRLLRRVKEGALDSPALLLLVTELQANLQQELTEHLFLCVPASRKWHYLEPEKWFGESVIGKFPDARDDARDCARCLALDQWTAAVFHAMGVVEHGLRSVASQLQVQFARPVETENWKNLIDQIEKQIRAMEQQPKTPGRDADLQFFSTVASHFFYIKEAWRNHVSHVRGRYDEAEAVRVVQHVRDIMTAIGSRV